MALQMARSQKNKSPGVCDFRQRTPADLVEVFGKKEVSRSLGTTDPGETKARSIGAVRQPALVRVRPTATLGCLMPCEYIREIRPPAPGRWPCGPIRQMAAPKAQGPLQATAFSTRPATPAQAPGFSSRPRTRSGFVGGGISTASSLAKPKRR